jgi:hypothetical protein
VREAADYLGVSERTIWRWLTNSPYADADVELLVEQIEDRVCLGCDEPLPEDATIRRVYCDATCRQRGFQWKRQRERFASHRPVQDDPHGSPSSS